MREAWVQHYSDDFVHDSLIVPLGQFEDDIGAIVSELEAKSNASAATKAKAESEAAESKAPKTTEVVPFNLTKPKPRIVAEPEVLPGSHFQAKPVPDMSGGYMDTEEQQELEAIRAANRKAEKEKYADPRHQPFQFTERPMNKELLIEQVNPSGFYGALKQWCVQNEIAIQEATKQTFKAVPAPKPTSKPAAVTSQGDAVC